MASLDSQNYKLHCLEKENERLIESVKHARQNALALAAAVLIIVSGVLNIGKPLVSDLNNIKYDGGLQECLIGKHQTDERRLAVPHVTKIWNIASFATVLGSAFTILFTVLIFIKSGRYAPVLDKATSDTISANDYIVLLTEQADGLRNLNNSYRCPQILAAISALVAVTGASLLTLLWLCFGGSS